MFSILGGIVGAIARFLLGKFFGRRKVSDAERAGVAETELKQTEAANDLQAKAAATRAADDTAVLRNITDASSDADAKQRLKKLWPGQFRD